MPLGNGLSIAFHYRSECALADMKAFLVRYVARLVAVESAIHLVIEAKYWELLVGTKKTGKGRRKIGRKKRRMRAKIRHRKK